MLVSFEIMGFTFQIPTIPIVTIHRRRWWTLVDAFKIMLLQCIQLARKCENILQTVQLAASVS